MGKERGITSQENFHDETIGKGNSDSVVGWDSHMHSILGWCGVRGNPFHSQVLVGISNGKPNGEL